MLGLWDKYKEGTEQWAECVGCHIQLSCDRLVEKGKPDHLVAALHAAMLSALPAWKLWPQEAAESPERWIQLLTGLTWAEVERLVKANADATVWEPFAQALQKWEAEHRTHGGDRSNASATCIDHGTNARGIRRRLQKRANDGDELAEELLSQLASGDISVNAAAIEAGMRQEYFRVRMDDPDKAAASIVARMGSEWAAQLVCRLEELLTA
jgi:hypothetical protein